MVDVALVVVGFLAGAAGMGFYTHFSVKAEIAKLRTDLAAKIAPKS